MNTSKLLKKKSNQSKRSRASKSVRGIGCAAQRSSSWYSYEVSDPPLDEYFNQTSNSGVIVDDITGECVSTTDDFKSNFKDDVLRKRYELQDAAKSALTDLYTGNLVNKKGYKRQHRTCTCHRFRFSEFVSVHKSNERGNHFYGGLMQCGNAKTCPVCAAKINERKSNELRAMFNLVRADNYHVSLLTFTVPHTKGDSLYPLIKSLTSALSGFWAGNPALKFKQKYGIIGHVRAFEFMYGKNGWHPHFHILVVSKKSLPTDKKSDGYKWILERWQNMAVRNHLNCPNEFGLDVSDGSKAGQYINKYGSDSELLHTNSGDAVSWDFADETAKGSSKKGKKGSFSPFGILEQTINTSLTAKERFFYTRIFRDFAQSTHGLSLLKWSRGFRKLIGLGVELTDEQIVEQKEDNARILACITKNEWKEILKRKHRALVIELCNKGGKLALCRYLWHLSCNQKKPLDFSNFLIDFNNRSPLLDISLTDIFDIQPPEFDFI